MAPYDTVRKHFRTLREREENSQKLLFWSEDCRPQDFVGNVSTVGADKVKFVIEALKGGETHASYKGWADCRICGEHLGSQDLYAEGFIWPSKAEHYIQKHAVWTPDLARFAEALGYKKPGPPTMFDKLFTEDLSVEEKQALAVINRKHGAGSDDEFWVEHRRNIKTAEFSEEFERWGGWRPDEETRYEAWRRYMTTPEFKERQKRILQIEEREVNKDGSISCGVFIPIPYNLAKNFPDKSEHDDSVPHFTILYVGDCSPEAYKILCNVVRGVARNLKPFQIDLAHYSEFKNREGLTIAHMAPGMLGQMRLALIHGLIRRALEQFGKEVEIKHTYGVKGKPGAPYESQFLAHATLAYQAGGVPYTGPKPTGSWTVNEIECWGHEKVRIPLGKTKVDQPTGLTRSPLAAHSYPAAVPNGAQKDVLSARFITTGELRARARDLMKRTGLSGEELLRKMRQEDVIPGGLADKSRPEDFDPVQLAMGIKVELEHTNDPKMAREIAMDHLKEDPRYYTKLKKVHHESQGDMTRLRGYESHPGLGGSSGDIGLAGSVPYLDGLRRQDEKLRRKKLKGLA